MKNVTQKLERPKAMSQASRSLGWEKNRPIEATGFGGVILPGRIGPFSLNRVWDRAIAAGRLFGLRLDGLWMHVGDPAALADEMQQRVVVEPAGELRVARIAHIGERVDAASVIEPHARLHFAIHMGDELALAQIGDRRRPP